MSDELRVLAPGCKVKIAGEIAALVVGVWIKEGPNVSYSVVWWDGRQRREEWVTDSEVEPIGQAVRVGVGFVTGAGP